MSRPKKLPLYIDGRPQKAISGKSFANFNPATGAKLSEVEQAGRRDV